MIGVTISLFATVVPADADRADCFVRSGTGFLQFAAILEHEYDGLCRRRNSDIEHGEHHREFLADSSR